MYPKYKRRCMGQGYETRLVDTPAEEAALGPDWTDCAAQTAILDTSKLILNETDWLPLNVTVDCTHIVVLNNNSEAALRRTDPANEATERVLPPYLQDLFVGTKFPAGSLIAYYKSAKGPGLLIVDCVF